MSHRFRRALAVALVVATSAAVMAASPASGHASADGLVLQSTLSGLREVAPNGSLGAGDPDGVGAASIELSATSLCFRLDVTGIELPAAAAHVHRAPVGTNGDIVVPLAAPGANGRSQGCADVAPDLLEALAGAPEDFYVNVHTSAFPAGAVRGQLQPAEREGVLLATRVGGAEEVGRGGEAGVGDPDGSGVATVAVSTAARRVCFELWVRGITLPAAAAHIHAAPRGVNGPVVVPLAAPDAAGRASGCARNLDQAVVDDLAADPTGHYVNVHTADFPDGAVRGQLARPGDFAGLVDVGNGRSIYMECRGSGGPTVVLVAGLGDRADTWMTTGDGRSPTAGPVFQEVARSTRVCAYDRPGTATESEAGFEPSRSTPLVRAATAGDSAVDLHRLLAASGEPGPYILVGHSLGGPIVRLYAAAHPADVAGLVLEDALSENLGDRLSPAHVETFEELNDPVSQGRPAGSEETLYTAAVVPLLRAAPPVPEVPTVILTADRWPFTAEVIDSGHASGALPRSVTKEFTDALWAAQLEAQDELAALLPGAEHVTETDATHYIHLDNPQLVIDSIRDVVHQVRSEPPEG